MGLSRRGLIVGGVLAGTGVAGLELVRRRTSSVSGRTLRATPVDRIPPAAAGESLDFLVTGDTGQDTALRSELAAAMLELSQRVGAKFVVLAGDNVYPDGVQSTEDPAWQTHFEEPYGELAARIPFYPCLGNHDYGGNVEAQIEYSKIQPRWVFPAPYHSFSQSVSADSQCEFFVLDTPALRLSSWAEQARQVSWVEDALERSTARWKVAIGHHPMYSGGPKGGSSTVRWELGNAFARNDVDLYLSGHNHDLELLDSKRGWLQVISGAGAQTQDVVESTEHTLFKTERGGFAWVSLREEEAWIQFESTDGALGAYRVERGSVV